MEIVVFITVTRKEMDQRRWWMWLVVVSGEGERRKRVKEERDSRGLSILFFDLFELSLFIIYYWLGEV